MLRKRVKFRRRVPPHHLDRKGSLRDATWMQRNRRREMTKIIKISTAVIVTLVTTLIVMTATPLPLVDVTPTHTRDLAHEVEIAQNTVQVVVRGIVMATTRVIFRITGTADTPIRSTVTPVARSEGEIIIAITPDRSTQTIAIRVVTVTTTIRNVTIGRDQVNDIPEGCEPMTIGRHGDRDVVRHGRVLGQRSHATLARDTERRPVVAAAARRRRKTRKINVTRRIVQRTTTVHQKSLRK
jgi:hypothetical protein